MTLLESQVARTRRRLWFIRWLRLLGWSCTLAAGGWIAGVLVARVFAMTLPYGRWLVMLGLGALLASLIALVWTRESHAAAARELDRAVGLRDRIATSLHVQSHVNDPYAQAVVADAEARVAGLNPSRFLPIRWMRSWSWAATAAVIGAISLLLPELDLFQRDAAAAQASPVAVKAVQEVISEPVIAMKQVAENFPDLAGDDELKKLDRFMQDGVTDDPEALQRDAMKALDKMKDALQRQAEEESLGAWERTRDMLKKLDAGESKKSPVSDVREKIAGGKLDDAAEALRDLQQDVEQSGEKESGDSLKQEEIQSGLDQLAAQLEAAATTQEMQKELKNAGLTAAEAQRLMEKMSRADAAELKELAAEMAKRLESLGLSPEEARELAKKAMQQCQACKNLDKLSKQCRSASKCLKQGDGKGCCNGLGAMSKELSQWDKLQQSVNKFNQSMSALSSAKSAMCNGNRPGSGLAPGKGSVRNRSEGPSNSTATYADDRVAVTPQTDGQILGQQHVSDFMLRGRTETDLHAAFQSAETDAADRLEDDRVLPEYRKCVRSYFDRIGEEFTSKNAKKAKPPAKAEPNPPSKAKTKSAPPDSK